MLTYENDTSTQLRLVRGDVRDASERFIVIGRNRELRAHYRRLTGNAFHTLSSHWMDGSTVEVSRAGDRSLNVFATSFRPRGPSRRRHAEIRRLQAAIEYPLARMLSLCDATEVALVPISCRSPAVVAAGMVRIVWDISVAAFLNVSGPFQTTKPKKFTIFCDDDLQPFVDVLGAGHYPSMNNGWLFNTEVQCNRAKRARYVTRRKFRFRLQSTE